MVHRMKKKKDEYRIWVLVEEKLLELRKVKFEHLCHGKISNTACTLNKETTKKENCIAEEDKDL